MTAPAPLLLLIPALNLLFSPLRKQAVCSWYGAAFDGRPTASTQLYSVYAYTAAHRTLPFGTVVLLRAGLRCVVVTISDRGPFVAGREFDLSRAAFCQLADSAAGLVRVGWRVLQ